MLDSLLQLIVDCFVWLYDQIVNASIIVLNFLIVAVADIAAVFVDLLPASASDTSLPVTVADIATAENTFLGVMSWFLPIQHIVSSLSVYLGTVVLYFTIGPLLRWVKIIK